MTVRAVEVIAEADVVAYHSARHGRSIARSIAAKHLRADHIEERAGLPGHHGDHRPSRRLPGRDGGVLRRGRRPGWPRISTPAARSRCSPRATRSSTARTCTCTSGSPTATRPRSIPGVTSVSAAAARLGTPLVEGEEVLTILPGTLPEEELTARLAATDAAVVMKLGRTFPKVRRALERSGRLAEARYVERATMAGERTGELADVGPGVGAVLLGRRAAQPGRRRRPDGAASGRRGRRGRAPGPPGPLWLTPETRGALAAADDLVGYTTYLDRVPRAPGPASGTAPTTGSSRSAPSSPSTWPGAGGGSPSSPAATRASSPWRPPCWRSPRRRRTRTSRCGCCRG